jgi:CubicO group peptidase (beta-lactamase class C family)
LAILFETPGWLKMLNIFNLEQHIEEQMKATHVPGLSMAIVKDQEIIYARGFGVTSVEDGGLAVTPRTLFRVGSVTKPMTGTMIMRLVEQGKLDLDRPVKEYIDWFTLSEPGAAERVTMRMLLSHTSGLPTSYKPFGPRNSEALEKHVKEEIPHYQLVAPPGKLYSYSNPGINLAGYVAQAVTGFPYAELMRKLVFDPLEMKRTTFDPLVAMTYPVAQSHDPQPDGTMHVEHQFGENAGNHPSGFAMSTVLDLANFAVMYMHGGSFHDIHILSPEAVMQMHTPQSPSYTVSGSGYGLTFMIYSYKGLHLVGHDGDSNTFLCRFVMVPDAQIAIIMMVNRFELDLKELTKKILDQLLDLPEDKFQPQMTESDRSLWPLYTGNYLGPFGLTTISIEEDHLTLDFNGQKAPLQASRKNLYFSQHPETGERYSVYFLPEEMGPVQYVMVNGFRFKRIERETLPASDPSLWPSFVGTYADFDQLTISIKDDLLYGYSPQFGQGAVLVPLDRTRFITEAGLVEFLIDESGKVSGLAMREHSIYFPKVE